MTKTKKFNIIDAFVILIFVALIAALGFKFFGLDDLLQLGKTEQIQYTIEIKNLKDVSEQAIPDHGELYTEDDNKLGEIISKETKQTEWDIVKADGQFDRVEMPNRSDVILTLSAEGLQKDEGFFLYGTQSIGVGSTLKGKTATVVFEAQVTSITKMD